VCGRSRSVQKQVLERGDIKSRVIIEIFKKNFLENIKFLIFQSNFGRIIDVAPRKRCF